MQRHQQETSPPPIVVRLVRRWRPVRHDRCGENVARVEQRETRERHQGRTVHPGFRGACHRAGHFGPDPLAQSGLRRKKNIKEAERRKALFRNLRTLRCGAAPTLTLPRLRGWDWEGAARLPAFHHGSRLRDFSSRRLSVRPGFVGGGAVRGELPSPRRSHFQRCTSRAGLSAGRLMPEPPGSEGDEPKARGHRTRSAKPASPAGVLHVSEIRSGLVTETETKVNENGTPVLRRTPSFEWA